VKPESSTLCTAVRNRVFLIGDPDAKGAPIVFTEKGLDVLRGAA
jgi:hypothetical protein